jgi:hypothetical protein
MGSIMLMKQDAGIRQLNYVRLFLLLCLGFAFHGHTPPLYGDESANSDSIFKALETSLHRGLSTTQVSNKTITYYLYIADFALSFIEIPTSNVSGSSSTISSTYLAGRALLYNEDNLKSGTCSASFLCMQNADGIYTDISNYISVDNGLIVTWFTPTTLINLELDSIIHSMVTECMVLASTKVGVNPFYGQTFNLVVSSDDEKIYFQFTRTGTIF